jgi:hypothetical protein
VAIVAACGGDGGSDASPTTTAEDTTTSTAPEGRALTDWQEASRAVCEEYDGRLLAVSQRLSEGASDQASIAIFRELVDVTIEYVAALREVPLPAERTLAVERLHDRLDRGTQSLEALRSSLARGDYGGFRASLSTLSNYADTDEQYTALGVPECAADT